MLSSLAYIILLGLALGYIFSLLRLPALLGMLIAGIALGSSGFNVLDESLLAISIELRQIALVIILLRAGLALNLKELKCVGRPAVLMCFVPACLEIVGITLLAPPILGISHIDAALMGTVLAAVSPAVIVPKMLKLKEQGIGGAKSIPQMIMAAGAVDDIFVIVLFSIFMNLSGGGEFSASALGQIPISIVTGLALGFGVGSGLVAYFRRFHMRDSVKLLIIFSCALLFLGVENYLKGVIPISGLLAVMAMGVAILSGHEALAIRISPKLNKLWVAAEIVLFVLVGASVDVNYALCAGFAPVVLILLALPFRMVGVFMSTIATPLNLRERLFCMIAYTPKATVQAAIGSLPLAAGVASGEIILTVAVLAILLTAPLGAFGIDLTYRRLL